MPIDIDFNQNTKLDPQITQYYAPSTLKIIAQTVLNHLAQNPQIALPYFDHLKADDWQKMPKQLEIYLTDPQEGRQLNLEARGKDYATNILSYPSDLPQEIQTQLPSLPLGELILCHEVIATQAHEQNKPLKHHITHLIVHGILHLLGFDHELGETEQAQMEALEIAILAQLQIPNPYEMA